jgi:hypothetical protein
MAKWHVYRAFGGGQVGPHWKRAARRRLQRIRFHDNWPIEMWILVIALIMIVFMTPRLIELHYELHHATNEHAP